MKDQTEQAKLDEKIQRIAENDLHAWAASTPVSMRSTEELKVICEAAKQKIYEAGYPGPCGCPVGPEGVMGPPGMIVRDEQGWSIGVKGNAGPCGGPKGFLATLPEFQPFPKMARLSREVIITEKIDGSNGQIFIDELGGILAGSRNRWLTPENDNFGFCKWVYANQDELRKLGPGRHFGEWWGSGIQRTYGLDHKRFSLFNVNKWFDNPDRPACCGTVPLIWRGVFDLFDVRACLGMLEEEGSFAAPGFLNPEGIVIYHVAAGVGFKKTIKDDGVPKSLTVEGL